MKDRRKDKTHTLREAYREKKRVDIAARNAAAEAEGAVTATPKHCAQLKNAQSASSSQTTGSNKKDAGMQQPKKAGLQPPRATVTDGYRPRAKKPHPNDAGKTKFSL